MEAFALWMIALALAGIGWSAACIAEQMKRANDLRTAELRAAGIAVEGN